eukprot:bmy_03951T0
MCNLPTPQTGEGTEDPSHLYWAGSPRTQEIGPEVGWNGTGTLITTVRWAADLRVQQRIMNLICDPDLTKPPPYLSMDILHVEINPTALSDIDTAGVRDSLGHDQDLLPVCVVSRPAALKLRKDMGEKAVRKGPEGLRGGWPAIVGPNQPQRFLKAGGGEDGRAGLGRSPGFPSTSGAQLPSFLAPQPSPLRSQVSPHPASAPSPSPLPTHAKGQQKNVEQELDTFHSSFHRHGCLAWGRGDGRGIRTGRGGISASELPAGPRDLPCGAPIPGPSHPETRGQIHVSQPPLLPAGEGWGRPPPSPDPAPPPPRPGTQPRAPAGAGAGRPPSALQPPGVKQPLPTQLVTKNSPQPQPDPQALSLGSNHRQTEVRPAPPPPHPARASGTLQSCKGLGSGGERGGSSEARGEPVPTPRGNRREPRGLTWVPRGCALLFRRGSGAL